MAAPRSVRVLHAFDVEYRGATFAALCAWDLRDALMRGGYVDPISPKDRRTLASLKCWPLIEPYTNPNPYSHDELEARWVAHLLTKD